jgi:hypothetical protein
MTDDFVVEVRFLSPSLTKLHRFSFDYPDRMEYEQTAYSAQCGVQCPKGCTCEGTTVTCRGLQLQEIPSDIPPYTTVL